MLVHVAVIALLILVSFTVPQPDEDAGGIPVMMGNVESARGFDDPSLVDVDVLDEDAAAPAETQPELRCGRANRLYRNSWTCRDGRDARRTSCHSAT